MKQKTFWRAFLDGLVSIGRGMALLSPFPTKRLPSYKEQFGTDEECLASDQRKVENDLHNAMKHFEKESNNA